MTCPIIATRPAGWISADERIGYARDSRLFDGPQPGSWSVYALLESESFCHDQKVLDWAEINYPKAATLNQAKLLVVAAWQHPKCITPPPSSHLRARAWYDCEGIPYGVTKTVNGHWVLVRQSITDPIGLDVKLRAAFDDEMRACLFETRASALEALAVWRASYQAQEDDA